MRRMMAALVMAAAALGQQASYEMTTYVVAFLKKGPAWTAGVTEETKKIQAGHMANIQKMAASGKLILAGPFGGNSELRGMFVFHGVTVDEASAMAGDDPAVKSGRLVLEFHPWHSAKGITIVQEPKKEK